MQRLSVEEFKEADKLPLIVVLDDVRSMHNVGSVFRTGDAFRIEAVYLCGITSTPPMAEIHKTALGAEDSVNWKYFPTAMEALDSLKADGYEVYAVEQAHGSTMLQDFKPETDRKYAVILGNLALCKNKTLERYMSLLDIILLAIALAMDCFAVSIVSGVLTRKRWLPRMAFLFGFFQALMPLIGLTTGLPLPYC